MASAFPLHRRDYGRYAIVPVGVPRLSRQMTLHASLAVMAFSVIQIAGVIMLHDTRGGPLLPIVALVSLMIFAVPFTRHIERRWANLARTALPSATLLALFRRDRARLWRVSLLVPVLWLGGYAAVAQAAILP